MSTWRDRMNQLSGRTRFTVSRIFVHLRGQEVAPLLGVLNQAARQAIDAEGDMQQLGEGLVNICQSLLDYETFWQAAGNEGDVFYDEGEADDFVTELFTDSAQRYGSSSDLSLGADQSLALPATQNVVVMLTVAYEGEAPALETDLAEIPALKAGLNALINLHYDDRLRAIQVHFSPAQFGDELTADQVIEYYPELIPL